jgi:anti-anti-sigma factor
VTLKVAGELDLATASGLDEEIAASGVGAEHVNLDFSECGFIDSTGLQAVIGNARRLRDGGGRLTVSNLEGEVLALFEITGLLIEGSAVERL